ncbi:uncharacterized protein LOC103510891 isoform X2 [Diaphorina citri]|uniref:Uncharacterized protein LOC103510891 isoform X2 n=1 Tax=Diaphorina citri TaxID=121845 RepID=A0A1S3D3U8_DIACI|nr:uncharacterized protein LOC103510891 isoform X2 [Diaphorina citri]KAI5705874.1 hypothetical protein M8J75_002565 [Diaphorina citri]KAI5740172.1 hypothetical protein M8J76_001234 [Diaphorina citri]KAI5748177.1 hypothetical protein M8J77_022699 [Diaphorina citri]
MCSWVFDSILLAGVAISVHYCLVLYIDKKEPLPPFLQEFVDSISRTFGKTVDTTRERLQNVDSSDIEDNIRNAQDTVNQLRTRRLEINILDDSDLEY